MSTLQDDKLRALLNSSKAPLSDELFTRKVVDQHLKHRAEKTARTIRHDAMLMLFVAVCMLAGGLCIMTYFIGGMGFTIGAWHLNQEALFMIVITAFVAMLYKYLFGIFAANFK